MQQGGVLLLWQTFYPSIDTFIVQTSKRDIELTAADTHTAIFKLKRLKAHSALQSWDKPRLIITYALL